MLRLLTYGLMTPNKMLGSHRVPWTLVSPGLNLEKCLIFLSSITSQFLPSLLVEKHDKYIEEEDRVKTSLFARCWRCKSLCQYCSKMLRRGPNFGNFRTE